MRVVDEDSIELSDPSMANDTTNDGDIVANDVVSDDDDWVEVDASEQEEGDYIVAPATLELDDDDDYEGGIQVVENVDEPDYIVAPAKSTDTLDMTSDTIDGFNPETVQNALSDESEGGGARKNVSTTHTLDDDEGEASLMNTQVVNPISYELTDFSVMSNKYEADFRDIRAEFSDLDIAKACVNGEKFVYVEDGQVATSSIVGGTPSIYHDDVMVMMYVEGKWRKP